MTILDAARFRPLEGGPSFPLRHRAYRLCWQISWLAFGAWTPPFFKPWRRALLNLFGADLALGADVRASARVWYPPHLVMEAGALIGPGAICYNVAPITIGRQAVVSQRAHLCSGSHDVGDPHFQLVARPIRIGARAWVAAEAFVGPGVTVGPGAVLGSRAVAVADLEAWTIHRGNPAQVVGLRALRGSDPVSADTHP